MDYYLLITGYLNLCIECNRSPDIQVRNLYTEGLVEDTAVNLRINDFVEINLKVPEEDLEGFETDFGRAMMNYYFKELEEEREVSE